VTFTPKAWGNPLSNSGNLEADEMIDLEVRLAAYADSVGGGGAGSRVEDAGDTGAALEVAVDENENVLVTGTVTADCTVTFTGYAAGATITLDLVCDATSRVVTVPAGLLPAGAGLSKRLYPLERVVYSYVAVSDSTVRGVESSSPQYDFDMTPADYGLLCFTGSPEYAQQAAQPTSGRVHLTRMKIPYTMTLASLRYAVAVAGVDGGAVMANCFMGVYNQDGSALLGQTASQVANFKLAANTVVDAALTVEGGQSLTVPRGYVWVAHLVGTAASTPTQLRVFVSAAGPTNFGLVAASPFRSCLNAATGLTALPASVTLGTATASTALVAGCS
jgi:hypothetical protein